LQSFYQDVLTPMQEVTGKVKKMKYDLPDLVDLGWCFRMLAAFADDLRKEAGAREELIGRLVALEATKRVLADPMNAEMHVRGVYATGLPDVKQSPKLPKAGTDDFKALCDALGVAGDAKNSSLVRFHFPSVMEWISERAGRGDPIPDGMIGTYPVYRTTFRTNKAKGKKTDGKAN